MAGSTQGKVSHGDEARIRQSWTAWTSSRQPSRFGMSWLVWAGLSIGTAILVLGCGSKSSPPPGAQTPPPNMAPPGTPPAGMPPAGPPSPGPSPTASTPGAPGAPVAPSAVPAEAKKPARTLPEKIADWQPEDYLQARRVGDPRLKDAVKLLGHQNAGGRERRPGRQGGRPAHTVAEARGVPTPSRETGSRPRLERCCACWARNATWRRGSSGRFPAWHDSASRCESALRDTSVTGLAEPHTFVVHVVF